MIKVILLDKYGGASQFILRPKDLSEPYNEVIYDVYDNIRTWLTTIGDRASVESSSTIEDNFADIFRRFGYNVRENAYETSPTTISVNLETGEINPSDMEYGMPMMSMPTYSELPEQPAPVYQAENELQLTPEGEQLMSTEQNMVTESNNIMVGGQ